MKLYRGFKDVPKFFTPDLQSEWNFFQSITEKEDFDWVKDLGKDGINRYLELRPVACKQYFTDNETIAETFAGKNGCILEIEVPQKVAVEHFKDSQVVPSGNKIEVSSNFVFSAKEIAKNLRDGSSCWEYKIIDRETNTVTDIKRDIVGDFISSERKG